MPPVTKSFPQESQQAELLVDTVALIRCKHELEAPMLIINPPTQQFFRPKYIAEKLGVTRQCVRKWQREGRFSCTRIGKCVLVPAGEVWRMLEENNVGRTN